MPERQSEELGDRFQLGVVADHHPDVGRHLAGVPAGEQFVQAVALLRHQQHDRLAVGGVVDLPGIGVQISGDDGEPSTQLGRVEVHRVGPDLLPGEEPAGFVVGVVRGLGDPAADVGQERGDPRDDARCCPGSSASARSGGRGIRSGARRVDRRRDQTGTGAGVGLLARQQRTDLLGDDGFDLGTEQRDRHGRLDRRRRGSILRRRGTGSWCP